MIHLIAGLMLAVAAVTLGRNGWVMLEQGNRGSAIAHFVVAGACVVGAIRAWWRWRRDTVRRLAKERAAREARLAAPPETSEPSSPPPKSSSRKGGRRRHAVKKPPRSRS
ncbi:MAG: hypothetical protein H6721_06180 [Sandaracinus sp.]|nr:hypothetical protein [Sandaracinus sp.]MCB9631713.1 hypothetical protein [Sandaracinus sp.]